MIKHRYIDCSCSSPEHTLRFTWIPHKDYSEIIAEVYLTHYRSFLKRLWYGIKYVFGCKPREGCFSDTMLLKEQVVDLRDMCEEFLKDIKGEIK
jgi:hypothetical protein